MDQASVTLFALLTGDDIHQTFADLVLLGYPIVFVSRIYIYSFVTIFITSVLNVFIFIIEESFFQAKQSSQTMDLESINEENLRSDQIMYFIFLNLEIWNQRQQQQLKAQELQVQDLSLEAPFPSENKAESELSLQPLDRAIERAIERALERVAEKSLERTVEKAVKKAVEKAVDKALRRIEERMSGLDK